MQLEKEAVQERVIDGNTKSRGWCLDTASTKGRLVTGTNVNPIKASIILHTPDLWNSLLQDTSMAGIPRKWLNILSRSTF